MDDLRGNHHHEPAPPKRNFGKCKIQPPSWLDRIAKEYWRRIAPSLAQEGILNPVTFDLLATAAQAFSTYRAAVAKLKEEGRVITTSTGTVKTNPWLTVEKQAFEQLCRVFKELDVAGPVAPVDDELDIFLEGK